MFKTRQRKLEEEAKKDPNYRPTSELEPDESNLPEEEKGKYKVPLTPIIVIGVLLLLIIACIITIFCLGNPFAK